MALQDAEQLLAYAVAETTDALGLTDQDAAAVKLARDYAAVIDASRDDAKIHAWTMRNIAPLLLDCLEALGATPAARARLKGGKPADAPRSRLQALRDARQA